MFMIQSPTERIPARSFAQHVDVCAHFDQKYENFDWGCVIYSGVHQCGIPIRVCVIDSGLTLEQDCLYNTADRRVSTGQVLNQESGCISVQIIDPMLVPFAELSHRENFSGKVISVAHNRKKIHIYLN
jgi:hypothetical protein